jgi:hypothetical protein
MPLRAHHIPTIALLLCAGALSGCASINEKLSAGIGETLPLWAGGLPADAPPRPGTTKYDEYMKERERLRKMPAAEREREQQAKSEQSGLEPAH